jgi:hypothetical protein
MNAINNERYVVSARKENDHRGTLWTHAFFTIEEAWSVQENKLAEVTYDMEPKYVFVNVWDAELNVPVEQKLRWRKATVCGYCDDIRCEVSPEGIPGCGLGADKYC